jgi:hypothetical protein
MFFKMADSQLTHHFISRKCVELNSIGYPLQLTSFYSLGYCILLGVYRERSFIALLYSNNSPRRTLSFAPLWKLQSPNSLENFLLPKELQNAMADFL